MKKNRTALWALPCVLVMLAGCAGQQPLYQWNAYQSQVYAHLKNDGKSSPEEQIAELEKGIQLSSAGGVKAPPGYYAHLGLLYLNTGKADSALNAWLQEKKLFPESAQYIDYLIGNLQKNRGQ